ncbi:MAG: efflux RND transporter periplasmic adaptor subunit [Gammaproteobacteria bacterium]|nr:efflux RND transporter periplasmic adaptor subunit [Gammaproteobacteria bacterium]
MSQVNIAELIERLRSLRKRSFQESPLLSWADFLNIAQTLCLANSASVLSISMSKSLVVETEKTAAVDSLNQPVSPVSLDNQLPWLQDLIVRSLKNGFAIHHQQQPLQPNIHWLSFRLSTDEPKVLLLQVADSNKDRMSDIVLRGQMLADVPNEQPQLANVASSNDQALSLLSVLPDVYSSSSLSLAGYTLVNGLISHSDEVDQAALGWVKGEYVKIENISHFDRFEHKTELVKLYEAALEEAVDQQATIHLGNPEGHAGLITLAHQQLQRAMACEDIVTLVIFDTQSQPIGCLLLVKMKGKFNQSLLHSLSFTLSLLSARLQMLQQENGGLWLKVKLKATKYLSWVFGKEWLWTKVATVLITLSVLWLLFGSLSFRIESSGEFITDRVQLISAPQDGVITKVSANVGDNVNYGQTVIELKKQDLILQLTELGAERQRFSSEEDKARAANNIIETEIAKARKAQIDARTSRVQLMLDETQVTSPFDGVIIEGERKNLLGLPIRKGDTLMRIAKIEDIYLTLAVNERDIHHISIGDTGEFALVSQPLLPLPFIVEQIIPVAYDGGQKGAQFQIKASFVDGSKSWWRPGMTGVGKIDKGQAAPYWVLGRKSYHQLRLMFWW